MAVGKDARDQRGDVAGGGEVGFVDGCGTAEGADGGEGGGGGFVALDKKNIGPSFGEGNGYCLTDSSSGTGDEGGVAFEGEHVLDAASAGG